MGEAETKSIGAAEQEAVPIWMEYLRQETVPGDRIRLRRQWEKGT